MLFARLSIIDYIARRVADSIKGEIKEKQSINASLSRSVVCIAQAAEMRIFRQQSIVL